MSRVPLTRSQPGRALPPLRGLRVALVGLAVAVWIVLAGVAVVAAPVLVAWLGEGATEPLGDVLRVAGAAWLLGWGATLVTPDGSWGLTPLGLTLVVLVLAARGGSWAATALDLRSGRRAGVVVVVAAAAVGAAVAAMAVVVSGDAMAVAPVPVALAAVALVGLGVAAGVLSADRDLAGALTSRVPALLAGTLRPTLAASAVLVAASAAATTVALVGSFPTTTSLLGQVDPGPAGTVALLLASLAYLPTVLVWALAVLAGPGVRLTSELTVQAGVAESGALPGFPLLGVVPQSLPTWLPVVGVATLVAAGLVVALLVDRAGRSEPLAWRASQAALSAGLLGLVAGLAAAAASGPMGPGTLSVTGVESTALGAAVGGVAALSALGTLALITARARQSPSLSDKASESAS